MAFLGSLFNSNQGAGFKAQGLQEPLQQAQLGSTQLGSVNLAAPTTLNQVNQANEQYQNQLGQTQNATQQAQGGIGQQQAFLQALQGQGGIGNQKSVFGQQQALANQLQGVASGTGPNPALAQLAQSTGANTANQAALMASQRGTSANSGLLAREAAQQGGALQQQAAGQGASLQAQQQLNAMQALQGQQAQMASLAGQQVGQQAGALGQVNSLTQAQQQAALAQQQAAQQQQGLQLGQVNAQNQAALSQQQALNQTAAQQQAALNQANVAMSSNINNVNQAMQGNINNSNAGIAAANQQAQAQAGGGALGAIGGVLGMLLHEGGEVPKHYDEGGDVTPASTLMGDLNAATPAAKSDGPQSFLGRMAKGITSGAMAGMSGNPWQAGMKVGQQLGQGLKDAGVPGITQGIKSLFGSGPATPIADQAMQMPTLPTASAPTLGVIPQVVSPLAPSLTNTSMKFKKGGTVVGEQLASQGKMVPGKAKVKGDSEANDIVDAKLSPGEIVIPRSIAQSPNAAENSAKFVQAVIERKHRKNG